MHWRILGEGFCFGEELGLLGIQEGHWGCSCLLRIFVWYADCKGQTCNGINNTPLRV